ncbi:MAG: membrane integrity-associated transporter subunit PqiC, partial [Magnetococcales bacterium]|nr:membrane integrity-associated transporter subunit PqiC [Magnetococcales bacterium]
DPQPGQTTTSSRKPDGGIAALSAKDRSLPKGKRAPGSGPGNAAPEATAPLRLHLEPIALPTYLERPQLVSRSGRNELIFDEFNQWGGQLRDNLSLTLVENLSILLGSERIFSLPLRRPDHPDAVLSVALTAFEKMADGQVVLEARWRVMAPTGSGEESVERAGRFNEPPPSDPDPAATVQAMSRLWAGLSWELAQSVREYVARSRTLPLPPPGADRSGPEFCPLPEGASLGEWLPAPPSDGHSPPTGRVGGPDPVAGGKKGNRPSGPDPKRGDTPPAGKPDSAPGVLP